VCSTPQGIFVYYVRGSDDAGKWSLSELRKCIYLKPRNSLYQFSYHFSQFATTSHIRPELVTVRIDQTSRVDPQRACESNISNTSSTATIVLSGSMSSR
jgi:hypothetical protein